MVRIIGFIKHMLNEKKEHKKKGKKKGFLAVVGNGIFWQGVSDSIRSGLSFVFCMKFTFEKLVDF